MSKQCCIIIGAGHAAAQLAPSLRREGWKGGIIVIGEEVYLPYNRPPISKTFLTGGKSIEQLLIRPKKSYDSADIEIMLGVSVVNIDRKRKSIELNNGEILTYTKLALTLGSRVRYIDLPGVNLDGIYYLRGIADAEKIRPYILSGKKVIIVDGGYVGLETAAMLNTLGMEVTVIEMSERILNRVTIPEISNFYMRLHREEGVKIITNTKVSGFKGRLAYISKYVSHNISSKNYCY